MASNQEKRREEVRFIVLRLLNENPEMSTRQIAKKIGISNGSAYYCLTELLKKGLLKLGNFSAAKHKGRYAYILTPRGIREKVLLTAKFLDRKYKEFEELKREISILEDEVGSMLDNSEKINVTKTQKIENRHAKKL